VLTRDSVNGYGLTETNGIVSNLVGKDYAENVRHTTHPTTLLTPTAREHWIPHTALRMPDC
jgi:hypothetical protein